MVISFRGPGGRAVKRLERTDQEHMALFSDYDIEEVIAQGNLATVYKCVRASEKQPFAVKVLSQELVTKHPEIIASFSGSPLAIERMRHPNIVPVIDRGIAGGLPYFVMEYVDGVSLATALEKRALDFAAKLNVALQMCKALSYAHLNGVIHRDIKPANVLIDKQGHVKVSDFGFAQMIALHPGEADLISGSPEYMSPEQRTGNQKLSAASDIYSLGVVIYKMFAGQLPGEPLAFPSYYDASVPAYVDEIVSKCLTREPAQRYPSAEAIKDKLLESAWGAHLPKSKKNEVLQGIGDIKTRFAVLDILKETDFGAVFLCENTVNHNRIIIKRIRGNTEGYKESTALGNLQHPNLVSIYSTSREDNAFSIVMEHLPGGSLNDRLVNPWEWKRAVTVIREVCQGLAFLHKNQLIHGNLRPSNILFTARGEVKITGCGLDEHYRGDEKSRNWYVYASEARTAASDMYSVGAILLEMVTGAVPNWHRGELVVNPQFNTLPTDVKNVLYRMLAQVPKDRYRSFDEVVPLLNGLLADDKPKRRNAPKPATSGTSKLLLVLLALVAIAALAFYFPEVSRSIVGTMKGLFGNS